MHDRLASLNSSVRWQARQVADWWAPSSGKPVSFLWLKSLEIAAGTQWSAAWQSAQPPNGGEQEQCADPEDSEQARDAELRPSLQVLGVRVLRDTRVLRPMRLYGEGVAWREELELPETDAQPGMVEQHRPGALPDVEPRVGEDILVDAHQPCG
jgi:hypothetical protein